MNPRQVYYAAEIRKHLPVYSIIPLASAANLGFVNGPEAPMTNLAVMASPRSVLMSQVLVVSFQATSLAAV